MSDWPARVLFIPDGQDRDAEGRQLGDDWELASCGWAEDPNDPTRGGQWYVTTNRVRCSEYGDLVPDAAETARLLCDAINAWRRP